MFILRLLLITAACMTVYGCTSLGIGKLATTDGSTYVAHSNDGDDDTDPRLVRIPAADHAEGAKRPIYWAPEEYPRYVGYDRNAEPYFPKGNQSVMEPIGYIPQVNHTFAYFEETYAVLNEKGVMMGESTCSAIYGTTAVGHGGKALLSIDTLSQIAMERASTAREAVQIMGSLSEKYGFYGPGSFEGSGESLFVGDPNEVYVFQILSDPNGTSSLWAAERVPDDSFSVVANMFIIREINFTDSENFLYSTNLQAVAEAEGLWKSGTPFDFTAIYSDGEYAHKYYSGRRMWRALTLAAPSQALSPTYDNLLYDAYPVHVPVDTQMSFLDVSNVMRDYYQGTDYDMTVGLAAGAFGTPDRYSSGLGEAEVKGNWERSIGMYRTSDSFLVQGRSTLPVQVGSTLWFGPHAAQGTCYVPFAAVMSELPPSYTIGHQLEFNRNAAFWAFRYVENLMNLKWSYMSEDVKAEQVAYEEASMSLQAALDADWQANQNIATVTDKYMANAELVVARWWNLADELMFRYSDGYITSDTKQKSPGYPAWWLREVNYTNGPPPPPSQPKMVWV